MSSPERRVVVMFGLPGAGKSFVARRFAVLRGFHFHDGDDELPADLRDVIARAEPVTEDMRRRFALAMRDKVSELLEQHPRVVLAQTFLKREQREVFLQTHPGAQFVLVTAPEALRIERLAKRSEQPLEPTYAKAMTALFDAPERLADVVIVNDGVVPLAPQLVDLGDRAVR